jgi:hypothetical protein
VSKARKPRLAQTWRGKAAENGGIMWRDCWRRKAAETSGFAGMNKSAVFADFSVVTERTKKLRSFLA